MQNLSWRTARRAALLASCAAGIIGAMGSVAWADATIRLVGQMPPRASLLLGGGTAVVNVNLTGTSSQVLFNLGDSTNGGAGYTISVISTNAQGQDQPVLTAADGSASVPYELTYGGVPLHFENGTATIKTLNADNNGDGTGNVALVPLKAGNSGTSYTDTLQFVIIAK
jgi:hypothetical protein